MAFSEEYGEKTLVSTYEKIGVKIDIPDESQLVWEGNIEKSSWLHGEGVFLERCQCHPDRKKKIFMILEKDGNYYERFHQ